MSEVPLYAEGGAGATREAVTPSDSTIWQKGKILFNEFRNFDKFRKKKQSRGTSLVRECPPLGPYRMPMPGVLGGS